MFDLSADEAAFVIAVDILGIRAAPRWAWR
jgi:hypothetical protein